MMQSFARHHVFPKQTKCMLLLGMNSGEHEHVTHVRTAKEPSLPLYLMLIAVRASDI